MLNVQKISTVTYRILLTARRRQRNEIIYSRYGTSYDAYDLVDHIRESDKTYIIQGQQAHALGDHTKPSSLDVWMHKNGDPNKVHTKQVDNDVIEQLVRTGLFRESKFKCPDNGRVLKGIEIVS